MVHQMLYNVPMARAVDLDVLGRIGHALADDTRRRVLVALLDGPTYPAELVHVLALSKANVSNHLACLRGCGLVIGEPEGRRVRYQLADDRLVDALARLSEVSLSPGSGLHTRTSRGSLRRRGRNPAPVARRTRAGMARPVRRRERLHG